MAATGLRPHHRRSHRGRPALGLAALLLAALLIALVPTPALMPGPAQAAKPSKKLKASGIPRTGYWEGQTRNADGRVMASVSWLIEKSRYNPKKRIVTEAGIGFDVDCGLGLSPVHPTELWAMGLIESAEKEDIWGGLKRRASFVAGTDLAFFPPNRTFDFGFLSVRFTSKTRAKGFLVVEPFTGFFDVAPPWAIQDDPSLPGYGSAIDDPQQGDCVFGRAGKTRRAWRARRILPLAAIQCLEKAMQSPDPEAWERCEQKYPGLKKWLEGSSS